MDLDDLLADTVASPNKHMPGLKPNKASFTLRTDKIVLSNRRANEDEGDEDEWGSAARPKDL